MTAMHEYELPVTEYDAFTKRRETGLEQPYAHLDAESVRIRAYLNDPIHERRTR